jgi:hypothetical protein
MMMNKKRYESNQTTKESKINAKKLATWKEPKRMKINAKRRNPMNQRG